MKKGKMFAATIILCVTFLFANCSNDTLGIDENQYTESQINVLGKLNGQWYDTQFSEKINGQYVNPTQINFGDTFKEPLDVKINGAYIYKKHGECRFIVPSDDAYFLCGFSISKDGTQLTLYDLQDDSYFHSYQLTVKNESEIHLLQDDKQLPYIFVKMGQNGK